MENNITKVDLEETIGFWARNDFAIINSLLVGNINNLWEIAEIAYKDNKDMLKEHEDGVRTLDEKSIENLQSRIIEKLDDETKAKILSYLDKNKEGDYTLALLTKRRKTFWTKFSSESIGMPIFTNNKLFKQTKLILFFPL